jgi:hypothetical protein
MHINYRGRFTALRLAKQGALALALALSHLHLHLHLAPAPAPQGPVALPQIPTTCSYLHKGRREKKKKGSA